MSTAVVDPKAARQRRRRIQDRIVLTTVAWVAIIMSLYPVAATIYNNYQAYRFAQSTEHAQGPASDSEWQREWMRAHDYNRRLAPTTLLDPVGGSTQHPSAAYRDYLSQLDATDAMGVVRIPSQKVTLPIFHGTGEDSLSRGAGHVYGTALPVGGVGTRTAISAHSALAQMTAFDRLHQVTQGDLFYLDVAGHTLAYQVVTIDTVLPDRMDMLKPVPGKDLATLVTCTPYGINSHRLLVTGTRVPYNAAADAKSAANGFDWTIQPWMWLRVSLAMVVLLAWLVAVAWWLRSDHRRRMQARNNGSAQNQTEGAR